MQSSDNCERLPQLPFSVFSSVVQSWAMMTIGILPFIEKKKGKLVFWWANLWNIWFLEPMFMKYEKQLLMWKVMCFMHFEPTVFLIPRLPLRVSRSASACHVSMGWNWTGSKFQNQNLSFPQKHSSRLFFLPSLSFDTHSSHLSSLHHRGEAENRVEF